MVPTHVQMRGLLVLAAIASLALLAMPAAAHTIDYVATDIQPQAEFAGQSGHFKVIDPVAPGGTIQFMLTFELIESAGGPTATLPQTVVFSVKNQNGDFPVTFGTGGTTTATYQFQKQAGKIAPFTSVVTAVAPTTPGSYHFKIEADKGSEAKGLQPGDGIVIHFRVDEPAPVCEPAATVLTVTQPECVVYHQPSMTFEATLKTSAGDAVAGKLIGFRVNDAVLGTGTTGADGKATYTYNPGALPVGDHTVYATFAGEECAYLSSSNSATFGVSYAFKGFQPPVQIDGIGAGLFSGKVIPVKIKIADYYGAPVPDAQARVYYTQTTQSLETLATAIQPAIVDTGNLMRYDAISDQYILNWDIGTVANGAYNIRVAMGEGEQCSVGHWAPVQIQKSGKKLLSFDLPAIRSVLFSFFG